jgi:hypothetical protein
LGVAGGRRTQPSKEASNIEGTNGHPFASLTEAPYCSVAAIGGLPRGVRDAGDEGSRGCAGQDELRREAVTTRSQPHVVVVELNLPQPKVEVMPSSREPGRGTGFSISTEPSDSTVSESRVAKTRHAIEQGRRSGFSRPPAHLSSPRQENSFSNWWSYPTSRRFGRIPAPERSQIAAGARPRSAADEAFAQRGTGSIVAGMAAVLRRKSYSGRQSVISPRKPMENNLYYVDCTTEKRQNAATQ